MTRPEYVKQCYYGKILLPFNTNGFIKTGELFTFKINSLVSVGADEISIL